MRRSSVVPVLLAALVCAFGCGGGGSATTPDPTPSAQATVEGNVLLNGAFQTGVEVVAYDLTTGIEVDRELSDPQGHYGLALPAGQFGVWATNASGFTGPQWVGVAANTDPVAFNLPLQTWPVGSQPGLLIGRVVDNQSARPFAQGTVTYGAQTVALDGFGFYTLIGVGANPAGTIAVAGPGFSGVTEQIRSGAADRTEFLNTHYFTVRPDDAFGTSIGGVLRNIEDASTLGGAIITLSRPTDLSFVPLVAQTNLGGVWHFYNLQGGTYQVDTHREGFGDIAAQAVLNERDGVLNLFLTPDAGALVSVIGTVLGPTGAPVNNVTVIATSGVYGTAKDTSDASGSFQLDGLVADLPYTFVFRPVNNTL
ncbi:MAG: carboxypeptidase-like regulatory domain-containing protein, partial [bacterium]